MAWTAGADVTTGDIITAATWNSYCGASGSLEYLKTEADKIDDIGAISTADTDDTIYQNTSGSIRHINVHAFLNDGDGYQVKSDASNPPTTILGKVENDTGGNIAMSLHAIVPKDYYYKQETTKGTPSPSNRRWDEH